MKIERSPDTVVAFKPFSVTIYIESQDDRSLLLALLRKMAPEVKCGGLYHTIIRDLRDALEAPA